jgi:hypothetical protein
MPALIVLIVIGFLAQLVDGALGSRSSTSRRCSPAASSPRRSRLGSSATSRRRCSALLSAASS